MVFFHGTSGGGTRGGTMGGSSCDIRGSTTSGDSSGDSDGGPQVVRTFRKYSTLWVFSGFSCSIALRC